MNTQCPERTKEDQSSVTNPYTQRDLPFHVGHIEHVEPKDYTLLVRVLVDSKLAGWSLH